jgi:beta-lactam-binding protein with PASTA domain
VAPGSSVPATVTVHNLGDEVEHFRLEVNGPAGAFATADPPELRMTKGAKGTAVIRFAPARRSDQPAGLQPFQVVARSTVNSGVAPRVEGTVDVGPFAELRAELLPEVTRGRRPGTQRLELVNAGNQPTTVQVELRDKDNELVFEPRSFDDRLSPGEQKEHSFTVCGPRPWFGRTQSFPFTAAVQSQGIPQPVRLEGTRRQVPRLPWWIPTVALALVGLAIALFALLRPDPEQSTVPSVAGQDGTAALTRINEAGYTAVAIEKPDDAIAAGTVIDTDPKGGAALPAGESVAVNISQGSCPTPCDVPVPTVTGLAAERAEELLRSASLEPRRVPRANDEPVDQVIGTEPAAAALVKPETTVTVFVSTGPASSSASPSSEPPGSTPPDGTTTSGEPSSSSGTSTTATPSPTPVQVTMPPLAGKALSNASSLLKGLGLALVTQTQIVRTDAAPDGEVLSTDPGPGEQLAADSTVILRVARPNIDLLDLDPEPSWADGGGVAVDPAVRDVAPVAFVDREVAGDDLSPLVLVTETAEGGSLTGRFVLGEKLLEGDRLRALVNLDPAQVTVTVQAGGQVVPTEVGSTPDAAGFRELSADLTGAAGAEELGITVVSPGAVGSDRFTWKDLRIEGQPE